MAIKEVLREELANSLRMQVRIPVKSAADSDFGRTVIPVSSDTYRSGATLDV